MQNFYYSRRGDLKIKTSFKCALGNYYLVLFVYLKERFTEFKFLCRLVLVSDTAQPSIIGSRGSRPGSFKFGYNFALGPSLFTLPWKSGFFSLGALRCNQMSNKLFGA